MEQAVVVCLIISFLPGFSQKLNLFPQGAINKLSGTTVYFSTVNFSQPLMAIRWDFNGNEMVRYSHLESTIVNPIYNFRLSLKTDSGELELNRLTLADSGRYTLNITFESGSWSQDHVFLQVFDPVYGITVTGPQGILIESYSSANFTCTGSGTIITTVWMKENKILYPSNSITFYNDNRTMVISPVKRTDSGIYYCVMSNPVNFSSAVSNSITVNYGPDVKILGIDTFNEGSEILLLCSPDSFPPATVTWTVKGMSAGNDSLFVKENGSPSDNGDYNCTCWNNVTGITASAVKAVTVKTSSRLAPGAEAGITLGVIFALAMLGVGIFFLVRHFKKPAERVRRPVSTPQINSGFEHDSGVARDNFHGQMKNTSHHIYENSPPPMRRPPLPPKGRPNEKRSSSPHRDRPYFNHAFTKRHFT